MSLSAFLKLNHGLLLVKPTSGHDEMVKVESHVNFFGPFFNVKSSMLESYVFEYCIKKVSIATCLKTNLYYSMFAWKISNMVIENVVKVIATLNYEVE
jgi:hypothetical protein